MSQKVYGKFTSSRALYFDAVSFLEYNNFTISITVHSKASFGRLKSMESSGPALTNIFVRPLSARMISLFHFPHMIRQTNVDLIAAIFVPLQMEPAVSAEKPAFFLSR